MLEERPLTDMICCFHLCSLALLLNHLAFFLPFLAAYYLLDSPRFVSPQNVKKTQAGGEHVLTFFTADLSSRHLQIKENTRKTLGTHSRRHVSDALRMQTSHSQESRELINHCLDNMCRSKQRNAVES